MLQPLVFAGVEQERHTQKWRMLLSEAMLFRTDASTSIIPTYVDWVKSLR